MSGEALWYEWQVRRVGFEERTDFKTVENSLEGELPERLTRASEYRCRTVWPNLRKGKWSRWRPVE